MARTERERSERERSERGDSRLKALDFWVGVPLAALAAGYRKFSHPGGSGEIRSVGLFCPGAIGDLILLTGLIAGLREKLPDASIEVVATSGNAACAELLNDVRVRVENIRRPDRIIKYIRGRKYDLLIDSSQWARVGSIISALSGAKLTIGFDTKGQYRGAAYDIAVPHRSDRHELDNFLSLGRSLYPDLEGEPELFAKASKTGNGIIYCHAYPAPGKGRSLKKWPERNWADFIRQALDAGYAIRLTGSKEDAAASENFARRRFPGEKRVVSIAGERSLRRLAEEMSLGSGLVSVNTGIMHLGAALGIPTIGLHGPTNPARWGPVGERTASLLPNRGRNAYLDLGFEYPENATSNMDAIDARDVFATFLAISGASRAWHCPRGETISRLPIEGGASAINGLAGREFFRLVKK